MISWGRWRTDVGRQADPTAGVLEPVLGNEALGRVHHRIRKACHLIRLLNRLACVGLAYLLRASLVVAGMPEVEVLTAMFPQPEEPCQPNERQTEHEVEELQRKHGRKGIPYFAVETDSLHHQVAGHKQASQRRDEHRPFAVYEHCRCGE